MLAERMDEWGHLVMREWAQKRETTPIKSAVVVWRESRVSFYVRREGEGGVTLEEERNPYKFSAQQRGIPQSLASHPHPTQSVINISSSNFCLRTYPIMCIMDWIFQV